MKTVAHLVLLLLVVVISCCLLVHGQIPRRLVTKSLNLDNGLDWGSWGPLQYCEDGSFAKYLEAKFEKYSILDTDETALNSLKLYCFDQSNEMTGHIESTDGEMGTWQGTKGCNTGYLTSMRARVLKPQGALGDDVAVENMQLECNYGHSIVTAVDGAYAKIPLGKWGDWSVCPKDSAICGIQTRYNAVSIAVDDAGLCDVVMFCCSLNQTSIYN